MADTPKTPVFDFGASSTIINSYLKKRRGYNLDETSHGGKRRCIDQNRASQDHPKCHVTSAESSELIKSLKTPD